MSSAFSSSTRSWKPARLSSMAMPMPPNPVPTISTDGRSDPGMVPSPQIYWRSVNNTSTVEASWKGVSGGVGRLVEKTGQHAGELLGADAGGGLAEVLDGEEVADHGGHHH